MNESNLLGFSFGKSSSSSTTDEEVFRTDDFFEVTIERGEHLVAADLNGFSDP